MIERYLASPAGPLFALESGEGDLVVLLHGVTANAYVFVPLIELLARRRRVIALDQRGHGRSPAAPDEGYGSADYARDVSAVIESLGGGRATVVGHSLGARNAVVAGATNPTLVGAVVAVDFCPFIAAEIFDALDVRAAAGAKILCQCRGSARLPDASLPPVAVPCDRTASSARLRSVWRWHAQPSGGCSRRNRHVRGTAGRPRSLRAVARRPGAVCARG